MNKTGNKEAGMYPPRLHWHAHRILRVVAMLPLKLPGGGLWSCQGASVPDLFRAQKEPVSSDRTGIVIPFLSSENTGSCRFYDFRSGSDCRMDDKSDSLKSQQQFLMKAEDSNVHKCMQPAYLFVVRRNYNKTVVVRHLQVKATLQKKKESAEAGKGTVAKE